MPVHAILSFFGIFWVTNSGPRKPPRDVASCSLFGNTLVTLGLALVSADLCVFTLTLVHKLLEGGIVVLGDGLRRHLRDADTSRSLDSALNALNGLLEHLDTRGLIQALAGQDVQWRSNQLNLDLVFDGVVGFRGTERFLDSVDSIVAEASNFNVGTDLGGVRRKLLADIVHQLPPDSIARELNVVPQFRVPKQIDESEKYRETLHPVKSLRDGKLEGIVGVTVFPVQWPSNLLVQRLERSEGSLRNMAHD